MRVSHNPSLKSFSTFGVPATAAPWTPGNPTVLNDNFPTLTSESTCMCSYGGVISVTFAGQVTTVA